MTASLGKWFEATILELIRGLTEFLPVSSSFAVPLESGASRQGQGQKILAYFEPMRFLPTPLSQTR